MNRFWKNLNSIVAALVIISALPGRESHAQTLQLGAAEAPELDSATNAANLAERLRDEIAELLALQEDVSPVRKDLLEAQVSLRLITIDLLALGDDEGENGSTAIVIGTEIARNRIYLDESIDLLLDLHEEVQRQGDVKPLQALFDNVHTLLREFARESPGIEARLNGDLSPQSLDRHVADAFSPLARIIEVLQRRSPRSHWIPVRDVTASSDIAPAPAAGETLPDLQRRLQAAAPRLTVSEEAHATFEETVAFLRRGAQLPALRPRVGRYYISLIELCEASSIFQNSDLLEAGHRVRYQSLIETTITLFADKETRENAVQLNARLALSADVVRLLGEVVANRVHRIDLRGIRSGFHAADADISRRAPDANAAPVQRLQTVLARMAAYRALPPSGLRGEIRVAERRIEEQYQQAEHVLLREIESLAGMPDAMSNPAFSTLLTEHEQLLKDLQRLREVSSWIDAIQGIDETAKTGFTAQTHKMIEWLTTPARRMDAVLAMDQFEQQLSLFRELPFERELRDATPEAISISGGGHEELAAQIDRERRRWAREWAAGNAGSVAANRLMLLYRLTQFMADLAHVARLEGNAALLNPWSAWSIEPGALRNAVSDAPNRLRLATQAAIDENDTELARQLDRLDRDAPVAQLIGRLWGAIGKPVRELPRGTTGFLGQILYPPTDDAWLIDGRRQLAALCRYAMEEPYARETGRTSLAGDIAEYMNQLALDLLAQLGDRREPIPTLIGFDGSDPNAKDGTGMNQP